MTTIEIQPAEDIVFTRNNVELFRASLVAMNAALAMSQAGLERNDPLFIETYSSRLCEYLQEKYKVSVSVDEAYQIGESSAVQLQKLRSNFQNGQK